MAFARVVRAAGDRAEPVPDRAARRRAHLLRGARAAARLSVTLVMVGVAIGLTFVSSSWIVWTVMLVRDAGRGRPASSADPGRRQPLGSRPPVGWRRRAGDADRLLHAGADRAVRLAARARASRGIDAAACGSELVRASTADRRRSSALGERSACAISASCSASRIGLAARALEEELRAVLAAQPGERRRRRAEQHEAASLDPSADCVGQLARRRPWPRRTCGRARPR